MSETTKNIGLTKPSESELYDVNIFSYNFQLIDDAFGEHVNDSEMHVTADERTTWDAKADKNDTYKLGTWDAEILTGADLNTYTTSGVYKCGSSATTASLLNKPDGISTGFKLTVELVFHASHLFQHIITQTASIYVRRINLTNSMYGDWQRLIVSTEFDALVARVAALEAK